MGPINSGHRWRVSFLGFVVANVLNVLQLEGMLNVYINKFPSFRIEDSYLVVCSSTYFFSITSLYLLLVLSYSDNWSVQRMCAGCLLDHNVKVFGVPMNHFVTVHIFLDNRLSRQSISVGSITTIILILNKQGHF